MSEIEEAAELARTVAKEGIRLSGLSWDIEQVLHRLRHARVGASGIQHRVIEAEDKLLADLRKVVAAAKAR